MEINKRMILSESIRNTFKGVTLEDGVGLKEAQGLDEYADEATRKKYREEDEKNDWSLIPVEKLERFHDSMSFFDPKGMRFHLPAFLIAQLKSEEGPFENTGFLTDFWNENKKEHLKEQFDLLSPEQRKVVREFLIEMRDDPKATHSFNEFNDIRSALDAYWKADP